MTNERKADLFIALLVGLFIGFACGFIVTMNVKNPTDWKKNYSECIAANEGYRLSNEELYKANKDWAQYCKVQSEKK